MSKRMRFVLLASLLVNVMAAIYFIPKIISKLSPKETVQVNESYWMQRDQYFNLLPIDTNSIVLLGTSHTHNLEIQETTSAPIMNRGINGDHISGMQNRLSPIVSGHPKKIIIEAGINDIGDLKLDNSEIIKRFRKLIQTISEESPQTEIIITSIFPVANESDQMTAYCSKNINTQIVDLNLHLNELSQEYKLTYLDVHTKLTSNKELNPAYSFDGVHLSPKGHLIWHNMLKSHLN